MYQLMQKRRNIHHNWQFNGAFIDGPLISLLFSFTIPPPLSFLPRRQTRKLQHATCTIAYTHTHTVAAALSLSVTSRWTSLGRSGTEFDMVHRFTDDKCHLTERLIFYTAFLFYMSDMSIIAMFASCEWKDQAYRAMPHVWRCGRWSPAYWLMPYKHTAAHYSFCLLLCLDGEINSMRGYASLYIKCMAQCKKRKSRKSHDLVGILWNTSCTRLD